MKKGSKLVCHWHDKLQDGMAYVMLGRCEILSDIFIAGKFVKTGIRSNTLAKHQMQEIDKAFDEKLKLEHESFENNTTISYLNVRSIKSLNNHIEDVSKEPYLMNSTIFCLGETWLSEGEQRTIEGFHDYYNSNGRGKGLAIYSKERLDTLSFTSSDGSASALFTKSNGVNIIFLYLSQTFNWDEMRLTLDFWISPSASNIIMGDVNWHFDNSHQMKNYLESKGFQQCITRATHEGGHKIDHLYVSSGMREKFHITILHQSVHFSDHDVIGIQFQNKTDD